MVGVNESMNRREMLKTSGVLVAGAALASLGVSPAVLCVQPAAPGSGPARKRSLQLAHLTDIHVEPELRADQGMAACLRHIQGLADKPGLILTGGDQIYDSMEQQEPRTKLLWDLWQRVWKDECTIPAEHCIGNHDIWGVNRSRSKTTGDEPLYGKKRAVDAMGIGGRFRSFDRAGWHFVVLDSIQPVGDGYICKLDEEQFEWLKGDLDGATAKPTLVLSHAPIVSVTPMMGGADPKEDSRVVSGARLHSDMIRITQLFLQHPQVKLCLSGHIHLNDRVAFDGVTYICDGAVSGNWWKGNHQQTAEGYGVVDLFEDGTFGHEYVSYGWKA
jgi:Icc protein